MPQGKLNRWRYVSVKESKLPTMADVTKIDRNFAPTKTLSLQKRLQRQNSLFLWAFHFETLQQNLERYSK